MSDIRLFKNWDRALLISLQLPHRSNSEVQISLDELSSLVYSIGGKVTGQIVQARTHIHPAYYFGKGKLTEIKSIIHIDEVDAVVVDNPLSPKQTQNLEKLLDCEVLDRTQVIFCLLYTSDAADE